MTYHLHKNSGLIVWLTDWLTDSLPLMDISQLRRNSYSNTVVTSSLEVTGAPLVGSSGTNIRQDLFIASLEVGPSLYYSECVKVQGTAATPSHSPRNEYTYIQQCSFAVCPASWRIKPLISMYILHIQPLISIFTHSCLNTIFINRLWWPSHPCWQLPRK